MPTIGREMIPPEMPAEVQDLVAQLYGDTTRGIVEAARRLGEMGPKAVSAAPFLASMLVGHFDNPEPNQAERSLIRIGVTATDAVLAALNPQHGYQRHRVLRVLARINPTAAVPALLDVLGLGYGDRVELGLVRELANVAAERVFGGMESEDVKLRRGAARALVVYTSAYGRGPPASQDAARLEFSADRAVELLLRGLKDSDAEVRVNALCSLARVSSADPKAPLPFHEALRAALKDESPAVRKKAIEVALGAGQTEQAKYDAIEPLAADPDQAVRTEAVTALGLLPSEAGRAVARLTALLADRQAAVREEAVLTLGQMRRAELEDQFLKAARDPSRAVQAAALLSLGRCGGKAGAEALIASTQSEDPLLRFEAARALAERCLDRRGAAWDGRRCVRMTGSERRWEKRTGLLPVPSPSQDPFPYDTVRKVLATLLAGPNQELHTAAAEALIEISGGYRESDDVVLAALNSPRRDPQWIAVEHLWQSKRVPDGRFLDPLRRVGRSPRSGLVDHTALRVLARMGDTENVLRECQRILRNSYSKVACGAAGILAELGEPGFDLLMKSAGDPRPDVRESVARALSAHADHPRVKEFLRQVVSSRGGGRGEGASQAQESPGRSPPAFSTPEDSLRLAVYGGVGAWRERLAALAKAEGAQAAMLLLKDPDATVRAAAAAMLGRLAEPSAVPALVQAVADSSAGVRAQAVEALAALGDRGGRPAILAALRDPEEGVREAAALALGQLGDGAAVEPLFETLGDPDWCLRRAAAQSLGGFADARAAQALQRLATQDPHWCVRRAAVCAMGRRADQSLVPALIPALEDEHWSVRSAAHESLVAVTRQKLAGDAEAWRAWWARQPGGGAQPGAKE
jgi:HEAT repeat protein